MDVRIPSSITALKQEPEFKPSVHLQLEKPDSIWSLKDFGYRESSVERLPFPLAATSPFRILSDQGVADLHAVIEQLKNERQESERIASFIRGTIYRSKFIRDLCLSPEVNAFVSDLAGAPVLPHPMALYQGHINLKPEEDKEIDRWHTDTVFLDYVLMCSDPSLIRGGHFEYFKCTKLEAIRSLVVDHKEPPVVKVEFPKAGFAILQQGHLIVHRANRVDDGLERTTFVQSYIPQSMLRGDISKLDDCKLVDPHEILFTEWARYKAFITQQKLEHLIQNLEFTNDRNTICNELRQAIRDVEEAIFEISDPSEGRLIHFGQDPLTGLLPEDY